VCVYTLALYLVVHLRIGSPLTNLLKEVRVRVHLAVGAPEILPGEKLQRTVLSFYLSIYLSICLSICLERYGGKARFNELSYLSIYLSICLFVYLSREWER